MDGSRFERNVGAGLFGSLLVAGLAIVLDVYVPWEAAEGQQQMSLPMLLLWGAAAVGLSMLLFTLFLSQHHHRHDIRIADDDVIKRFDEADRAAEAKRLERFKPPPGL